MANRARQLGFSSVHARPKAAPRLIRIERPLLGDDRVAEKEVRELPAQLLGDLPVPATLFVRVPGQAGPVAIATSAARAEAERAAGLTVFDPLEWSAIVVAAESDRLWSSDLREICARKEAQPGWALDLDVALAGARPDAPRAWTVGRVLDRIGATLVGLDC